MELEKRVFAASADNFNDLAVELFHYQYQNNKVYRTYCEALKVNADSVNSIQKIPFLPISFFKTHVIKTTEFDTDTVFESSGTSQTVSSKHFVKAPAIYTESETPSCPGSIARALITICRFLRQIIAS